MKRLTLSLLPVLLALLSRDIPAPAAAFLRAFDQACRPSVAS